MTVQVNVQEAKATLSRLLVAVEQGDEVIIARSGHPVARLVPVADASTRVLGFIPGEVPEEVVRPLDADEQALWA
jgi:prevent-host-death family protein